MAHEPTHADIDAWFNWQLPTGACPSAERLRTASKRLAHLILDECPPGPNRATAIRTLASANHFAMASAAQDGWAPAAAE